MEVGDFDTNFLFFFPGLNNSLKYLEEKGLSLHDYSYSPDFLDAILKGIKEVQFDGVSVSKP